MIFFKTCRSTRLDILHRKVHKIAILRIEYFLLRNICVHSKINVRWGAHNNENATVLSKTIVVLINKNRFCCIEEVPSLWRGNISFRNCFYFITIHLFVFDPFPRQIKEKSCNYPSISFHCLDVKAYSKPCLDN